MKIKISKPKQKWEVGDVLMTPGGKTYMICSNAYYYFMVDLETGVCASEYDSLDQLATSLICATDTKVNATLNIECWGGYRE